MFTVEERVRKIIEENWGDKEALIHRTVHEIQLLRAALPTPADLEAIAYRFETACSREVDLHDGTTFDASMFLRRAARLIRLTINEEAEPRDKGTNFAAHG